MICEETFSGFDEKKMLPQNQQVKKNHRNSDLQRLAYLKKVCASRSYNYIHWKQTLKISSFLYWTMAPIFGDCFSMSSIISITLSAICIGVTVRDLQQIKNFRYFPSCYRHFNIKGFNKVARVYAITCTASKGLEW